VPDETAVQPATPAPAPATDPAPDRSQAIRWTTRALIALAVIGAVVLVLVVAWGLDGLLLGGDTTARGTTVAGRDVGALSSEDLESAVAGIAAELAGEPVTVTTAEGELETTAGDLGISIDVEATADAALDIGHREPLVQRPFDWLGGLFGERPAAVTYRVNAALAAYRLQGLADANTTASSEPTIEVDGDAWVVVPGQTGEVLDVEALIDSLADEVVSTGLAPMEVAGEAVARAPRFTDDQAAALAADAERLTAAPLTVTVEDTSADVTPDILRTWFEPVQEGDLLRMRMKQDRLNEWLDQTFSTLRVEPTNAAFQIGFGVAITPSADGRACCGPESARQVRAALEAGEGAVTLDMEVVEPSLTTEQANALGIVEPVSSFTTNHACCEGRVNNIQRFADLIRGAVIPPGETFSLNEHVGQRTEEKGFVEAGAIYAGVYVQDVGGGVSQFATTTFNAAFFAGLDFAEYQAHTIYISRYPYGREATISWPSPDLKITNNSPYGVMIWPTYTGTSITVTLWSTKWVNADQTAQSERSIGGGCTRVTTERTRTFLDEAEAERIRGSATPPEGHGPNDVIDTVFAIYQPGEGRLC
jgi:vancomycin resistance protein YoaR